MTRRFRHNGRLGSLRDLRDVRRRDERRWRHVESVARSLQRHREWYAALPPDVRERFEQVARMYGVPGHLLVGPSS